MEEMEWRRFEVIASDASEKEALERLIREKNLSRADIAVILFGLRVRLGFQRSDFGI